jgi:hypothetical protein
MIQLSVASNPLMVILVSLHPHKDLVFTDNCIWKLYLFCFQPSQLQSCIHHSSDKETLGIYWLWLCPTKNTYSATHPASPPPPLLATSDVYLFLNINIYFINYIKWSSLNLSNNCFSYKDSIFHAKIFVQLFLKHLLNILDKFCKGANGTNTSFLENLALLKI